MGVQLPVSLQMICALHGCENFMRGLLSSKTSSIKLGLSMRPLECEWRQCI